MISEETYVRLSELGQKRARIMFWVEVAIGSALFFMAVAAAYFVLRALLCWACL